MNWPVEFVGVTLMNFIVRYGVMVSGLLFCLSPDGNASESRLKLIRSERFLRICIWPLDIYAITSKANRRIKRWDDIDQPWAVVAVAKGDVARARDAAVCIRPMPDCGWRWMTSCSDEKHDRRHAYRSAVAGRDFYRASRLPNSIRLMLARKNSCRSC